MIEHELRVPVGVHRSDGEAQRRGAWLGLPVVDDDEEAVAVLLCSTPAGLALQETGARAPGLVSIDLVGGRVSWRKKTGASRDDPLCRALGLGRGVKRVVDATAGLGRDACAMAASGLQVVALERSPILACLWADALHRAGGVPNLTLLCADAVQMLRAWAGTPAAPDAVYLDPMYPGAPRTALPQKEMRALRAVVGADPDVDALIDAALACARIRVVVKRPRGSPLVRPNRAHAFEGKSTRFDLYLRPVASPL